MDKATIFARAASISSESVYWALLTFVALLAGFTAAPGAKAFVAALVLLLCASTRAIMLRAEMPGGDVRPQLRSSNISDPARRLLTLSPSGARVFQGAGSSGICHPRLDDLVGVGIQGGRPASHAYAVSVAGEAFCKLG